MSISVTTIARINSINDLYVSFATTCTSIVASVDVVAAATVYMNSVTQTLLLDVIKRDPGSFFNNPDNSSASPSLDLPSLVASLFPQGVPPIV